MKKLAIFVMITFFIVSLLSAEETQYTNYSFARLSYVMGNTFVQKASDLGFEEGIVNMPIGEGDRLGTTDGRAEVYLGKRNYVRLDNNTKVDFLILPRRGNDLSRIRVWSGNVYFSINFLEKEKNFEIHTSDASIYILENGLYRIDVRENRETEIFVYNGLVEAAGEEGSVLISTEKRLELANGRFTSRPTQFMPVAEDSFDRWSGERDSELSKRLAQQRLPEELEDFEYELSEYGDWVYLSPYGWVWVPYGVGSEWRPYYYGRWTWLPICGWSWIPYEPWGWAPFHYGRWHWGLGMGWYWIPTPFWGPAWVNWWWGYDYFGWVPLGYYGYPIVIIDDVFYPRYNRGYYPYNNRALTVIRKGQMQAKDVSAIALKQAEIKQLGNISLTKKTPEIKPTAQEVTLKKLGENTFILKKEPGSQETPRKEIFQRITKEPRLTESKTTIEKGQEIKPPVKKETKAPAVIKQEGENKITPKKKIIKKEKKDEALPVSESGQYIKGGSYGYPASPKISIKNIPEQLRIKRPSSLLGRMYDYITGGTGSRYVGKTGKKDTSRGTSSRVSSRSSGSRTSSTVSRGNSSSGRTSSGSRSGTVTKKK